jgi:GH24 family phage-related lysozyme (muramidase)
LYIVFVVAFLLVAVGQRISEIDIIAETETSTATKTKAPTSVHIKTPTRVPTSTPARTASATAAPLPALGDLYFYTLPYQLKRMPGEWTVSDDGVKFVAFWEGFVSSPTNDGGAVGNCTIGYGQLIHIGPCDGSESVSVSQSSAYAALKRSLDNCGGYIDDYVKVHITQNQYNVMASLICNWGYEKFGASEIVKLTNQGRYYEAAEVWKSTATCGIGIGCGLPGLVRRRAMESRFFISPIGTLMWPITE